MHRLFPQKLLTSVTHDVLEQRLAEMVRRRGASGYRAVLTRSHARMPSRKIPRVT